jgi:acetolactate synthase-1/2/3 large subunit
LAYPGATIEPVFDALVDMDPQVVACRHEQNAAFMAAAVGRLTANTEQDPWWHCAVQ